MTYDLDAAIRLATLSALEELKHRQLNDINKDEAKTIIAHHAENTVPVYNGELLYVYNEYRKELMQYADGVPEATDTQKLLDPYVNWNGLTTAIHWYAIERMHDLIDEILGTDVT